MNKRFIVSLAVAAFIGLATTQTDSNAAAQATFEAASNALVKDWDGDQIKVATSCNLVDNFAFFNIQSL